MYIRRRSTIKFNCIDIAEAAGISISKVYSDIKRGKLNPKSLISIVEYITKNNT